MRVGTISEFGDFPLKWWGVTVHYNLLNSGGLALVNTGKRRNLRSYQGSAYQFFTETFNYGFIPSTSL